MGGFPLLDVMLGLAFVYLLLALVCSAVTESISQWRGSRGKMLEFATRKLFGEKAEADPLTRAYYDHPLIKGLKSGENPPSYVPSRMFAAAVKDILDNRANVAPSNTFADTRRSITAAGLTDRDGKPKGEHAALAEWYDDSMDRLSGLYKRRSQRTILWAAVIVTLIMNANTVTLTTTLWQNSDLRAYVAERARVRLQQGPPLESVEYTEPDNPTPTEPVATDTTLSPSTVLDEERALLGQLFGWRSAQAEIAKRGAFEWALISIVGWIITALAVSLGAPFWFDALNRIVRLRASGTVPARADAQPAKA